jgi:hypothetical protein
MEIIIDSLQDRGIWAIDKQLTSRTHTSVGPCDENIRRALIAEVKNKLTNINSEFFNLVASIVVETVTPPPQCRRLHSVTATCVFTTLSPIPDSKEAVPLDSLIRIVHTDNKNERYCVECGFPHNFQLKEEIVELAPITVINVQRNGLQQTFSKASSKKRLLERKILTAVNIPARTQPALGTNITPRRCSYTADLTPRSL